MSIFALAKDLHQHGIKYKLVVIGADQPMTAKACEERWHRHRKAFLKGVVQQSMQIRLLYKGV